MAIWKFEMAWRMLFFFLYDCMLLMIWLIMQKGASILHRTNGARYQTSVKCSFVYL